jgi:3-phosphoshikimate 1-carboxyvinyltransferase
MDEGSATLPIAQGAIWATVDVPGSKSIANRALVCAALAHGTSLIRHLAPGDDTQALQDCLSAVGVPMKQVQNGLQIQGSGGALIGGATVSARLAGTTSRFMIAVAALAEQPVVITGEEALRRRPIEPLQVALQSLGVDVISLDAKAALPVQVSRGSLHGGSVSVRGDVSSQFLSALMLIGPLLEGGLSIEVTSPLISVPYITMTAEVMSSFGIQGIDIAQDRVIIPSGTYSACEFAIEPDASSASYPLAAAAICGGEVTIPGLGPRAIQGDVGFLEILSSMGCEIRHDDIGASVRSSSALRGLYLDLRDMSDLVPTVAALAVFASSPTEVSGVGFIRQKESDRLGDLVRGLQSLGCDASETAEGFIIRPVPVDALRGTVMPTHHDHRLAMAWSLIGLRVPEISIDHPEVVSKSWPDWWAVRQQLVESSDAARHGQ